MPDTTNGLRAVIDDPGGIYYASAPEVVPQCNVRPLPIGRAGEALIPPYVEPYVPQDLCRKNPNLANQVNVEALGQGRYPITRPLFVVIKADGGDDERAGRAYADLLLTTQGQRLIEQEGFVPVR